VVTIDCSPRFNETWKLLLGNNAFPFEVDALENPPFWLRRKAYSRKSAGTGVKDGNTGITEKTGLPSSIIN